MKILLTVALVLFILSGCNQRHPASTPGFIIANGQMPGLVKDKDGSLQMVYGTGDTILYAFSSNDGKSFSASSIIAVLPGLAASHMRGPQIAASGSGIIVTASNKAGNIFSFHKDAQGKWSSPLKVNDADTVAKEGLMALSANDDNAFAVWLDLRDNNSNKIYGARSADGGRTWMKNILVYASPDTTVCECCKPSVLVNGPSVYVMFRNWLHGNRDMYLVQSNDGGNSFGLAQKLGKGHWNLNGCPMDGGGITLNDEGKIETVWRREGKIYSSIPGMEEREIGEGKGCTIESVNNKNVYAWIENGDIVFTDTRGQKTILGKGTQPVLKALNDSQVICVWENEKQIHASILKI